MHVASQHSTEGESGCGEGVACMLLVNTLQRVSLGWWVWSGCGMHVASQHSTEGEFGCGQGVACMLLVNTLRRASQG